MRPWTCATCGTVHTEIPDSYGYTAPWPWYTLPEAERDGRSLLDADYCVIDEEDFFVRGCLEIPVIGQTNPVIWGVWVSLSKPNFDRERQLAGDPARADEPPYFGWMSSRIQVYTDTLLLKTNVITRPVGMRPYIDLEPTDHPLAIDQRTGITVDRLIEIAEQMEHQWLHPEWDKTGF
jgi:hypothetical protein